MKIYYFLVCALLFSAFAKAQQTQDTTSVVIPQIYVKAFKGEQVTLGVASVKLIKVLEDSRCPKGVQCIWAGEAKVLIEVTKRDGSSKQGAYTISQMSTGIPLFSEDGFVVNLKGLSPYPDSAHKINPEDYFITLDIEN